MSRRSTPERIDEARRAATRQRLIGEGATKESADAWIAAWEARAAEDGLERGDAYWQAGWDLITEQLETRRPAATKPETTRVLGRVCDPSGRGLRPLWATDRATPHDGEIVRLRSPFNHRPSDHLMGGASCYVWLWRSGKPRRGMPAEVTPVEEEG